MTGQVQIELLYQVSRDLTRVHDEAELLRVLTRPVIGYGATTAQLLYFDLDEHGRPLWAELVAAWQSISKVIGHTFKT